MGGFFPLKSGSGLRLKLDSKNIAFGEEGFLWALVSGMQVWAL